MLWKILFFYHSPQAGKHNTKPANFVRTIVPTAFVLSQFYRRSTIEKGGTRPLHVNFFIIAHLIVYGASTKTNLAKLVIP
jgi:hypothetical protein